MSGKKIISRLGKIRKGKMKCPHSVGNCCVDIIPAVERMLIGSYVIT